MTNPRLLATPFAENGVKNDIPESTAAEPQLATLNTGFPDITQTPISQGGAPPERADFNGILNLYGEHVVHLNKGLPYEFDGTFAQKIGGYPLHARVMLTNGDIVRNTAVNNINNPNSNMTGWSSGDGGDISDANVILENGRTQREKNRESPTMFDFGAKGDGVTDDAAAYGNAINSYLSNGILVDGLGLKYKSSGRGSQIKGLKNAVVETPNTTITFDRFGFTTTVESSRNWQGGMTSYGLAQMAGGANQASGYQRGLIAIGQGAFQGIKDASIGGIAVGPNTLSQMSDDTSAGFNIAIGDSCLTHTKSDGSKYGGTRNIAVGSLAGFYNTTGYMNCFFGRDAGHNNASGNNNVAVGYRALMGGSSPIGWSGSIELQFGGIGGGGNVAIGNSALEAGGSECTSIGNNSLKNIKQGKSNIAIGRDAGENLDKDLTYSGNIGGYNLNIPSTYVVNSGSTEITPLSSLPFTVSVGDIIAMSVQTGSLKVETGKATITAVSPGKLTIKTPVSGATGSGECVILVIETSTASPSPASNNNTFIGSGAARNRTSLAENLIIGNDSFHGDAVGSQNSSQTSSGNTLLGTRTARNMTKLTNCTAIGQNAMRWAVSGATTGTFTGSTGLGSDARVSGDNQVQLGGSTTTVYAFGVIQDRSDCRDKTDIEVMPDSMIDFVLGLNAVQGVWDMRDDYVDSHPNEWTDEQRKEWWSNPTKDGSKKRSRRHNWFIAQEVKELADKLGIDFAGLQDHKMINGTDTLTIGYAEFIPPIVATLQKCYSRLDEIEARLNKLEGNDVS